MANHSPVSALITSDTDEFYRADKGSATLADVPILWNNHEVTFFVKPENILTGAQNINID